MLCIQNRRSWNQRLRKDKNILLRYTDRRYTSTKEIKEKMEQYGTVISLRNRKSEYEKTHKGSMVSFKIESEGKRVVTDIKHNYLHEGWHAQIYQSEKWLHTELNIDKKGTDNNNTKDPPRIEKNISNKHRITQNDQERKSLA